MKITAKDVQRVAKLAHIKVSGDESEKLISVLESMAAFADSLKDANTDNLQPTCHGAVLQNVLREDVVTNNYNRDTLLENAPSVQSGCFVVPQVVE